MYKSFLVQVPDWAINLFDQTAWMWAYSQPEKYREIQGIMKALNTSELTLANGVMMNSLYELQSWCTSVVAQTANGTIIHSRNLDFNNPDKLRKTAFRAKFYKNGTESFDAVMFAGTLGVYTGLKPGAFSISENQRQFGDKQGLLENLLMIFSGFNEISWIIRDTLENCASYECAYDVLKSRKINSIGYIILAGTQPGEGVVLSRNRIDTAYENKLNVTAGKWYIVQTNFDHWQEGCFNRCEAAKTHLDSVGQSNIEISHLRSTVLEKFPNFNFATVYNTVFVPKEGMIETEPLKFQWDPNFEQEIGKLKEASLGRLDEPRAFNVSEDLALTMPSQYAAIAKDLFYGAFV